MKGYKRHLLYILIGAVVLGITALLVVTNIMLIVMIVALIVLVTWMLGFMTINIINHYKRNRK